MVTYWRLFIVRLFIAGHNDIIDKFYSILGPMGEEQNAFLRSLKWVSIDMFLRLFSDLGIIAGSFYEVTFNR